MNRQQMISTLTLMGWEPVEDISDALVDGCSRFDLAHQARGLHLYHDARSFKMGECVWAIAIGENWYRPVDWSELADQELFSMFKALVNHDA